MVGCYSATRPTPRCYPASSMWGLHAQTARPCWRSLSRTTTVLFIVPPSQQVDDGDAHALDGRCNWRNPVPSGGLWRPRKKLNGDVRAGCRGLPPGGALRLLWSRGRGWLRSSWPAGVQWTTVAVEMDGAMDELLARRLVTC